MIYLEKDAQRKFEICDKILRALPEWFGIESAIRDYSNDVKEMLTFVAIKDKEPVGFVSLNFHNQFTAEIHVMAVDPRFHRGGIGFELLQNVEHHLRQEGFKFMSVKTLSESRPSREYDQTRRFYLKMGFYPVEEFKTLWGEHNPCLFLIKALD